MAKAKREIMVVEASGTPYEKGVQYGAACPEEIRKTSKIFCDLLGMERAAAFSLGQKFVSQSREYVPDAIKMMEGIAKGAKLDFEEIFFLNVGVDLVCRYGSGAFSPGCTTFAASGEATVDGETIIGQSIDMAAWMEDIMVILKFRPNNGPAVISAWIYGCMPAYGFNSAGLGVAANGFFYQAVVPDTYNGVPSETLFGYMILQGENISTALRRIYTTPRSNPNQLHVDGYMIANLSGDIVYVESTWNDFNIIYPERGFLVHTNHFVTERFQSADIMGGVSPDSYTRLGRLNTLMTSRHGELSVDVMKELYQEHNDYPDSLCRHEDKKLPEADQGATSTVFISDLKNQKLYVTLGQACENEFIEYKL